MSFGDGNLHDKCSELEARVEALEELARDLWPRASFTMSTANRASWEERLRALGIEVDA